MIMMLDLEPLSWSSLLLWVDQKEDTTFDFRDRSLCAMLNRSLTFWTRDFVSPQEKLDGVSLSDLFLWIWPNLPSEHVVVMLTWVCLKEIERIQWPTPPVIDQDQERRLNTLFESMDVGNKGYCTAEDIAGGSHQGIEGKLKNIVDADTVREFCGGNRKIGRVEFSELMCEYDFRAHDEATSVVLASGQRLRRHRFEVAGVTIWVLENPSPWELQQRQFISAIEALIEEWRGIASVGRDR